MKKLLIVRHAKADELKIGYSDIDRPLISRGIKNAEQMAARLLNKDIVPDLLVSSPALRAFTTAQIFGEYFKSANLVEVDRLYDSNKLNLLNVINQFDNRFEFIAIFGHNPGLTELLNYLTQENMALPTCGVALINFMVEDWALVSIGNGELVFFDYPKNQ